MRLSIVLAAIFFVGAVQAERIQNHKLPLDFDGENIGWTPFHESSDSSIYLDLSRIKRVGSLARLWVLINYFQDQTVEGVTYRSIVKLTEYDCKEEKSRDLTWTAYKRSAGLGDDVVTADSVGEWSYGRPGSIRDVESQIACSSK